MPRGTERCSRAAREAARATPQLAAAPVPPVAGEQRPQAAGCKAADLQQRVGLISPTQPHKVVMSSEKQWDEERICRRGTDGRTPMCRPMAPPSRPAAAVRVRLRAAERGLERGGLERGRSSFAVGRASRSVYENKIDLLTGVINALSRVFHRPECGWIDSVQSHTFPAYQCSVSLHCQVPVVCLP